MLLLLCWVQAFRLLLCASFSEASHFTFLHCRNTDSVFLELFLKTTVSLWELWVFLSFLKSEQCGTSDAVLTSSDKGRRKSIFAVKTRERQASPELSSFLHFSAQTNYKGLISPTVSPGLYDICLYFSPVVEQLVLDSDLLLVVQWENSINFY